MFIKLIIQILLKQFFLGYQISLALPVSHSNILSFIEGAVAYSFIEDHLCFCDPPNIFLDIFPKLGLFFPV